MIIRGFAAAAGLLVASLAVPAAAQGPSGDWVQIFNHEVGPIFLDRSSVRREGNIATARTRIVFLRAEEGRPKTVVSSFRYDCSARTAALLSLTLYRADGSLLSNSEVPADQRRAEPIGTVSPNASVVAQVCR